MWFCSGDGLNRFDGKDFIVYKSHLGDTSSAHMSGRNVPSPLFEDSKNHLWFSSDAGFNVFDPGHSSFKVLTKNYVTLLGIDKKSIWYSPSRAELYETNISTHKPVLYRLTDSVETDLTKACTLINAAICDSGLWITDNGGLLFFDTRKHKDRRVFRTDKLNSCYLLHDGRLLLCAKSGVYFYDPLKKTKEFVPLVAPQFEWKSCAEDTDAHLLYLAAGNGSSSIICKFDLNNYKYELLDVVREPIYCLYIDHSKNMWIGTEGGGVYRLDIKPPKFNCFYPGLNKPGASSDLMVKAIYRDDSGIIWIGSLNQSLVCYDPINQHFRRIAIPALGVYRAMGIYKDSSGRIIINGGPNIAWLDPVTKKTIYSVNLPTQPQASLYPPITYSVVEYKKNSYLVATNIGLFSFDLQPGNKITQPVYLKELRLWTYKLSKGNADTIYVCRREGFTIIKTGQDTSIRIIDDGFTGLPTRQIFKPSFRPLIWITTEQGLVAYNERSKRVTVIDESDGLANSFVYAIVPENDSTLWVSTNRGLSNVIVHYRGDSVIKGRIINYSARDGLQSNEFNTGASYKAADGTMYFGGITGINWFKPAEINANPHTPIPTVSEIYVNDKLFAGDSAAFMQNLTLPYNQNTISFTLRALEFTRPENNRYAYKLEGVDKDWVITSTDKVRYSSLHPGNYTFLLKTANNDGVWNSEPLKIALTILPPYWGTWWFRSLAALAIIATGFGSVRLYIRQKVKARTRELEKQQALYMERLRISKDVHDDLGSGLSKISLMAELAQKKAMEPTVGKDIQHISSVSKELVDNMRDLIWVLNPENTTLEQLITRLHEYCADYLEDLPIKTMLNFPATVPAMRISREAQRNIFLTTKEAINNCVKHASACIIEISLSLTADVLMVSVRDNGKGFDPGHRNSGNGLRNMQQRIEHIGGSFSIVSEPGSTTILLSVPIVNLAAEKNTTLM